MNKKRLKYLIVMPRFVDKVSDGYQFPLGLPYISSSMKAAGYEVYTINLNHKEDEVYCALKKEIEKYDIDVVATGGQSVHYNAIKNILDSAKKINPQIITIVGGGIITSDPEAAMQALEVADLGVIGEGEITICEVCEVLESKFSSVAAIDGLIYKEKNGKFKINKPRQEIKDINTLPWPDYDGFEFDIALQNPPGTSGMNSPKTIYMISSRSCPFDCTFCFHTTGSKYRQRTLDAFFEELEYNIKKYGIRYLCLEDELFASNEDRVKEFCSRIKKFNISYWVQLRVSDVNEELLLNLKNSGCDTISYGLESADNQILESMKKKTTIEQIEQALKLTYDAGIHILGNFIFGDIAETVETSNNTIEWWKRHPEYKIEFSMITVYPGTSLYKYACEKGIIKDKVKFLKEGCPQINVSKLSDADFAILLKTILALRETLAEEFSKIEYNNFNYINGTVDVCGECSNCHNIDKWSNVNLFAINFWGCSKCGQKHRLKITGQIRKILDANIQKLINKYHYVAFWGINANAYDYIMTSKIAQDTHISFVDVSQVAQKLEIKNKNINSPEIINLVDIKAVVVFLPHHFTLIKNRVRDNYPNVEEVVSVVDLVNPNYFSETHYFSAERQ